MIAKSEEDMPKPIDLKSLQVSLPWTIRYSGDFRASPMTHKDFAHTMHHVSKAAGQLHALCDDMDHDREVADDPTLKDRYAKYLADLVVCALRLANTFPGTHIDLQQAVIDRIETKNGVKLSAEYTAPEVLTVEEKEFIGETVKGGPKSSPTNSPAPAMGDAWLYSESRTQFGDTPQAIASFYEGYQKAEEKAAREQNFVAGLEAIPQAALNHYHELLGPVVSREEPDPGTSDSHLVWMLGEMESMRGPKQHRWLGFIQGILILRGKTTVSAERDFTRAYFKRRGPANG